MSNTARQQIEGGGVGNTRVGRNIETRSTKSNANVAEDRNTDEGGRGMTAREEEEGGIKMRRRGKKQERREKEEKTKEREKWQPTRTKTRVGA
ncbi:hypothetical protein ACFX13_016243 [Malus domestica]